MRKTQEVYTKTPDSVKRVGEKGVGDHSSSLEGANRRSVRKVTKGGKAPLLPADRGKKKL